MNQPGPLSILQSQFLSSTVEALNPQDPISVVPSTPVQTVLEKLQSNKIGAVLIIDEGGELVGIFTERDAILKAALEERDMAQVLVSELMTTEVDTVKNNASVARAVHAMSLGGFRHLPIWYPKDKVYKVISVKNVIDDIYRRLTKELVGPSTITVTDDTHVNRFFASSVEILSPEKPLTVREEATVKDALTRLKEYNVGCVIVINENQKISGIFSERDYLLKVVDSAMDIGVVPVTDVMTRDPVTALYSTTVSFAFNMMSEGGYRHIPIVDDEEDLMGVLSVKSFITYLAESIMRDLEAS